MNKPLANDYDLLIRGGTVLDPAAGVHAPGDVAIKDGKIAAIHEPGSACTARRVLDACGQLVAPGLVDLHVHVFPGGSRFGIEADAHCLQHGVTTVLDAGTAGANSWSAFEDQVAAKATRVLALLNISAIGMPDDGELLDAAWVDADRAAATIASHRDRIVGVKVRLSPKVVGQNAERAFSSALQVSQVTGLPLMVHPNASRLRMPDILNRLRPGDIVTHCFNTSEHSVLDPNGRLRPEAAEARSRGVLFDVGHGLSSFSFEVAERAMQQGFLPDTISSDLHALNVDRLAHNLPHVLSKFLALGMSLDEVLIRATERPARILAPRQEIGTLRPGAATDLVLLKLEEGEFRFHDCLGATRTGRVRLLPTATVRTGQTIT